MNSSSNVNSFGIAVKPSLIVGKQTQEKAALSLLKKNHGKVPHNESLLTKEKDKVDFSKRKDPLIASPLRLFAYTNEVGAALAPIPVIGTKIFALSWVPALMYFGADIYDKFAKGTEDDYSAPSKKKAARQGTFQALASVIMPTAAVVLGQNVASKLSSFVFKDKMDVRVKEDVLSELQRDANQEKVASYVNKIEDKLAQNKNLSIDAVSQLDDVKNIKKELGAEILNDIKGECKIIQADRAKTNPIKKLGKAFVKMFSHGNPCENVAKVSDDHLDSKVKAYLDKEVSKIVDKRIELKRVFNPDGSLNANANSLEKGVLKKLNKLISSRSRENLDKPAHAIKECIVGMLNKSAMKLSWIKIIGGFTSLALLAHPIDKVVEKIVFKKEHSAEPKVG